MFVGIKNIQHEFADCLTHINAADSYHCLTGWSKLSASEKPYSLHVLYTCTYEQLKNENLIDGMHILCIMPSEEVFKDAILSFISNASILFVVQKDTSTVHQKLQRYFNIQSGIGMYGQSLLEFLSFGDSLQDAIDYSFNVFHNPIFVFDTNFNLIAATWEAIHNLKIEDRVIINKGFSDNDFKMANKNHFHNQVSRREIPILRYNEELGYEQLICSLNSKKNLGHIVLSAINQPFEDIDRENLIVLKKYINLLLSKDSFIRNSKGFNYEYFIKDLLDEKIKTDRVFSERTEYIKQEFSGNMYCFVIETARSMDAVSEPLLRNIVESRIPNSKVLIYNGQIVCIISMPKDTLLPQEYKELAIKICQEQGIYGGLSNCFQDVLNLAEYYNQALRSIELGIRKINEPTLFCYEEYYMDHVVHIFLQKRQSRAFCHPKMQILFDYDKAHKSELAYTMYIYLTHERNLASAADAMDMHRTSLVYRFKKINSLIGYDFDDYSERMHMILSYEMFDKS